MQAIELPYVGNEVSMVVFLPRSPAGLPRFEAGLKDQELAEIGSTRWTPPSLVTLSSTLPKMHLEDRYELGNTLKAMGAPTAFGDDADFSGMATIPQPGEMVGLEIARVIHKAWLDVDEEGAEAAAATAVVGSAGISDIVVTGPPPIIFRADKPFLFVLRDRRTGLMLFMGRYVGPLQG